MQVCRWKTICRTAFRSSHPASMLRFNASVVVKSIFFFKGVEKKFLLNVLQAIEKASQKVVQKRLTH